MRHALTVSQTYNDQNKVHKIKQQSFAKSKVIDKLLKLTRLVFNLGLQIKKKSKVIDKLLKLTRLTVSRELMLSGREFQILTPCSLSAYIFAAY